MIDYIFTKLISLDCSYQNKLMFSQSFPLNYRHIADNQLINYKPCPAAKCPPPPAPHLQPTLSAGCVPFTGRAPVSLPHQQKLFALSWQRWKALPAPVGQAAAGPLAQFAHLHPRLYDAMPFL